MIPVKLEKDHKSLEKAEKDLKAEADKLTKELAALASKNSNSTYTGGTMKWPLPGHYVVTSKFGNRLHPVLKKYNLRQCFQHAKQLLHLFLV